MVWHAAHTAEMSGLQRQRAHCSRQVPAQMLAVRRLPPLAGLEDLLPVHSCPWQWGPAQAASRSNRHLLQVRLLTSRKKSRSLEDGSPFMASTVGPNGYIAHVEPYPGVVLQGKTSYIVTPPPPRGWIVKCIKLQAKSTSLLRMHMHLASRSRSSWLV